MSENKYIYAQDLGYIRSLKSILKNIIPEVNNLIDKKEHNEVMKIISKWERSCVKNTGVQVKEENNTSSENNKHCKLLGKPGGECRCKSPDECGFLLSINK